MMTMLCSMTQRKILPRALRVSKVFECILYLAASYNLGHSCKSLEGKNHFKFDSFSYIAYKFYCSGRKYIIISV